jgi:hypothetical protein
MKRRMKPQSCEWDFGQKCLLENAFLGDCAETSAVNESDPSSRLIVKFPATALNLTPLQQ